MLCIYILLPFLNFCYGLTKDDGWNYINLHCRSNNNEPENWWYLYKPAGVAAPYDDTGRNFSYIISDVFNRWVQPNKHITTNNMLQHTLTPIYRSTYQDQIAYLIFDEVGSGRRSQGAKGRGILIVDELGGIFISHTVPKLVDSKRDRPRFPDNQLNYGHLIACISMDIGTLNELGVFVKHMGANIITLNVPKKLERIVPAWKEIDTSSRPNLSVLPIPSNSSTLNGVMLFRWPGQDVCLYSAFAKSRGIVLDVYAPDGKHRRNICTKNYGVRTIDSISLKIRDERVQYLYNRTDKSRFAVSTTAHWQWRGSSGTDQLWTCTSSLDRDDDSGKGGFLICVNDNTIWEAFDNLKVKEPEC